MLYGQGHKNIAASNHHSITFDRSDGCFLSIYEFVLLHYNLQIQNCLCAGV